MSDTIVVDDDTSGILGQRVVRNYAIASARLVLGQGIAGIVFYVLSHRLSAPGYALFSGFGVGVQSMYFLVASPLTTVLSRDLGTLRRGTIDASMTFVLLAVCTAALPFAAIALFRPSWGAALVGGTIFYGISLAFSFPSYSLLFRNVRTGSQAILDFLDRVAFQLVTITAILCGLSIGTSLGLAMIGTGVVFFVTSQKLYPWRPRLRNPAEACDVLKAAAHPFSALLSSTLCEALLIPAIALVAGAHAAGLYGWSYSVASVPMGFIMTALIALQPAFTRLESEAVTESALQSTRIVAAVSVIMTVTVAVAARPIIELLLPLRWLSALPTLYILLAAVALHGVTNTLTSLWNARMNLQSIARWQNISYGLGFAVGTVAAWRWGAPGGAAGYLVARIVLTGCLVQGAHRHMGLPVGGLMARFLALAAAAAGVGVLCGRLVHAPGDQLGVSLAAGWCVLCLGLAFIEDRMLRMDVRVVLRLLRGGDGPVDVSPSTT